MALVFGACKKNDSKPAPTKTELLTQRAWKITQVKANNTPLTDDLVTQVAGQAGLLGELYASDVLFKADGTFTATNRTTQNTFSGTWTFNADQTQLTITTSTQTIAFKITKLTSDILTMDSADSYTVTIPILGTQSVIVTLDLVPAS